MEKERRGNLRGEYYRPGIQAEVMQHGYMV